MKTADLDLTGIAKSAKREGRGFARLWPWGALFGKRRKKFKAGTHPAAGGASGPGSAKTRIAQSVGDVLRRLERDGAKEVLVLGDAGFFAEFQAAAGVARHCRWATIDLLKDGKAGAALLERSLLPGADAIVAGGPEIATAFRYALRCVHAARPDLPVHWVAENWEFCAGTAAIPAEIDDVDALVFNHFEEFFGIKDPLQFRFEIIAESGNRHLYRVLGPSESVNLNLRSLMPDRAEPICLKVHVAHPYLTRGRHYRFRVCADVFWKDSFTIIHGSHQFFKNPDKEQQFRLIETVIRPGATGEVIMTVPNYDLDMGARDEIVIGSGAKKATRRRSRKNPVEAVHFAPSSERERERRYFAASYHGYGTSFWYAFEENFSRAPGKRASIAGNHLCRVGVDNRADIVPNAAERAILEAAHAAGFMIHPCALPVLPAESALRFGFNFDASNPPFDRYRLRLYDRGGNCLDDFPWRKDFIGPAFIDELLAAHDPELRAQANLALVSPDHLAIDLAPQRFVTTADLVLRHAATGDQDATEFQSSWRNLGTAIPSLPHWLHPAIGIMGRTNVIGRVRTKGGYRTGVFVANASGRLAYDMAAAIEIAVINNAGRRLSHFLTLPAFGGEIVWLDDRLPGLPAHVGESGIAALQVKSADADLTAHVIGLSPQGAIGLQHLWGY